MKKIFVSLCCLGVISAAPFMLGFSLKESACKISCEEALKKCDKEAGGDPIKEALCEKAYQECLEKCKK
jgi:hypothetical protein